MEQLEDAMEQSEDASFMERIEQMHQKQRAQFCQQDPLDLIDSTTQHVAIRGSLISIRGSIPPVPPSS